MKKHLVYFFAIALMIIQADCSFAASNTGALKIAAKKYQAGNYTGCLQDCQDIISRDPSNAVAYYYMAMSYTQAGKKDKAIEAYSKVLTLKPNAMLASYANTGKKCLETPELCISDTAASQSDIDKFLASPSTDPLSSTVRKDLEQQQLNVLKEQINSGKDMDVNSTKLLNDASEQVNTDNKIALKKPTEEEVTAALKVLNEAGVNPYSSMANYQNPQAVQLQMLSAFNNNPVSNPNDGNAMLNMIPQLMEQSRTGQGQYSPQMMQAFIMNSLTGNMNTDFMNNNSEKEN